MLSTIEPLFYAVLVTIALAAYLRDRLRTDPTELDTLKARYAAGEIGNEQFERELEFVVDDRNDRIRAVVEDVTGVGPATSEAIAREYDSLDDLRASSDERLEGVHGVGEGTREAVFDRVRD